MAHITGGGIPGNLSRILPEGTTARIEPEGWTVPPLFSFLQRGGDVPAHEMFRAFNMGIGLILACAPDAADLVTGILKDEGEDPKAIGDIIPGDRTVII
jgi:phosphoribosylformylglycinamidine cyclo-ligase